MQCTTYDYSSQGMFQSRASPLEYTRRRSTSDHHQLEQATDVVSSTVKPVNEEAEHSQEVLQCPICAFTAINRISFTEHLATHCNVGNCDAPEFVKTVLNQLTTSSTVPDERRSSPTQGERSGHESEEADEPGLRVPRLNSQGKVKTFRCKQCNFVAITKLEFWEHSRGHIKAEKLLTCPKCPFVTEYKHHLEYHLRNHFGSKPFKCDKCSYSCVNKSMLNSHLKSHSNIYQYRCANCSYATKYCHSLKLHLRKYSHQPAMVLNADGSPNPLPIIDVYGTRRGPKQKLTKQEDNGQSTVVADKSVQIPMSSPQLVGSSQISPLAHPRMPMDPINGMNGAVATVNNATTMSRLTGVAQSQPVPTFPYNPIFTRFSLAPFPTSDNIKGAEKPLDRMGSTSLMDYLKAIDGGRMSEDAPQDLVIRYFNGNNASNCVSNGLSGNEVFKVNEIPFAPGLADQHGSMDSKMAPLDLSKPNTANNVQKAASGSTKVTGTSRRKGKAVKLDRRVIEEDTDEEQQSQEQLQPQQQPQQLHRQLQQTPVKSEESSEPSTASSPGSRERKDSNESSTGVNCEYTCQYCEIAFGNCVMYTVHMGYHGFKDPFTCNMCGHQCTDKVSFFLHIARSKHS